MEIFFSDTHFPVCTGRKTGHLTQVLILHPFVLGALANFAGLALHGGTASDRL